MAEIKVRGLPKEVVIRLDSMAKKKNMSRNKYLKESLENDLVLNEMKKKVGLIPTFLYFIIQILNDLWNSYARHIHKTP